MTNLVVKFYRAASLACGALGGSFAVKASTIAINTEMNGSRVDMLFYGLVAIESAALAVANYAASRHYQEEHEYIKRGGTPGGVMYWEPNVEKSKKMKSFIFPRL